VTSRVHQPHRDGGLDISVSGLVGWLALASALELLVLRTFTRTAIHIPGLEDYATPYRAVAFGARYAYFLAVVLLVALLPCAALALWRTGGWSARALGAGVGVFVLAAAAALAGADRVAVDAVTVGAVVFAAAAAVATGGRGRALALGCFGAAFALSGVYSLIQGMGIAVPAHQQQWLLSGVEVLGVGAALTLPFMVRERLPSASLYAAIAAGLVTFGMFLSGGGATARILLLWNEGLTGLLPAAVYAAAAAAVAATVVALLSQRDLTRAAGVTLLISGGIGLHSTYQSGLVLIALVVLLLASAPPTEFPSRHPVITRSRSPEVTAASDFGNGSAGEPRRRIFAATNARR
jgi:hypothetical protein